MSRTKLLCLDLFGDRVAAPGWREEEPDMRHRRLTRALAGAVEQELTPRQRQCVQLYYFERNTLAQTAEKIGVTEATVSRHLKKARLRLKRVLQYTIN